MQEQQSPTKPKQANKVKKMKEITTVKRSRIANYPYYPVTDSLSNPNMSYIFNLDLGTQDYLLSVLPFKKESGEDGQLSYQQLSTSFVQLQCLPKTLVNFLKIIEYEDSLDTNGRSVTIRNMDFVIGFSRGYLLRLKYQFKANNQKRELSIVGKFNKKPDYKESLFTKVNNSVFGSQQFYKSAEQKPVRGFYCHTQRRNPPPSTQKFHSSYLIGNNLYLCREFSEPIQSQCLRIFANLDWASLPLNSIGKINNHKGVAIKSNRHQTLICSTDMLIKWADEISSYCYTAANQLIVADNQDNKIIVFDLADCLKVRAFYSLDFDVKRINYCRFDHQVFLVVMPYDTALYVLNLTNNTVSSLKGHRSYVTQAIINEEGYLMTGGCDHRIALKNMKNLKEWSAMKQKSSTNSIKQFQIESSQVPRVKPDDIYFLGEFNNVNSQRNNNSEYGFGSFLQVPATRLYAYITFDYIVKVYQLMI